MQTEKVYQEKIIAKVSAGAIGAVVVLMAFLLVYQVAVEPLGDNPAPSWFFLIMLIVFLVLLLNFGILTVTIDNMAVTVGFGAIKRRNPFENFTRCYRDEAKGIRYGGAGIRIAKIGGKRRLAFIVTGGPRCVLTLKEGKFAEFVFSTKNPDEVINVINGQLVLSK